MRHGHLLTTEGLKSNPEKVRAITALPRPENQGDILRLNDMVTYLSRFLPHLSDVIRSPSGNLIRTVVQAA